MIKIQRHCSSAFALLALLCLSGAVSLAQKPRESNSTTSPAIKSSASSDPSRRIDSISGPVQIPLDPYTVLPPADALLMLDLKRFTSDVVPRLLVGEPFDRAIAISPVAPIYTNRGLARSQKSDYDGAIVDFDKAISLDPKSADAYNFRGLAHYYKVHLDQAIADYDKAIAIDPNFAEAYGNRALSLLTLRRDAQAAQDFKRCFELDESLRPVFDALVKEIKKIRPTKPRN